MPRQDVILVQIGASHFKYTDPISPANPPSRAREVGISNDPEVQENPE
jgi:hypothetical protein